MASRKVVVSPTSRIEFEREYRRRIAHMSNVDQRAAFQVRYWNSPSLFAAECIDWQDSKGLAAYQDETLKNLVKHKRAAVRGPHGLGKTALNAITILWFAFTRDGTDWKVVTTASAWRQLTKYLWPEVHKWVRRVKWDAIGRPPLQRGVELLDLSLKLRTGEAFAVASDNADLIEGAHADHLLYIFDEGKAIPVETWDAAEGAFSTGDCMALAASTPGEPSGRFYDIQRKAPGYQDWWTKRVTKEEAIAAGRMERKWVEARRRQWGEKSAVYQNRVEGEFAASDEDGIIALADIERANQRWNDINDAAQSDPDVWGTLDRLGVDVGRGGDPSVIARRHGFAIKGFDEINIKDVMSVTGRVRGILAGNTDADAVIDVIGIGAGAFDRLRERPQDESEPDVSSRVLGFNAAEHTDARDKSGELGFVNDRAWAWWTVRELLQDDIIALPPDDTLTGDLTAPKWKVMSGGRVQIEDKAEIRKRIGRSTNYGDAVVQAFWKRTGGPKLDEIERYGQGKMETSKLPADLLRYMKNSGVSEDVIKQGHSR